jgi:proline dehydrogenase
MQDGAIASSAGQSQIDSHTVKPLDFSDHSLVFKGTPTSSLLLSWAVYKLCGIPWFVDNAPSLLTASKSVLGSRLTNSIVKHTFYKQFCAGALHAFLDGISKCHGALR